VHQSLHICIAKTTLFALVYLNLLLWIIVLTFANLILINSEPSFLLKYQLSPCQLSFSGASLICLQKSISYCLLRPNIFCHLRSNFLATFLFLFLEFWTLNPWTLNNLAFSWVLLYAFFWMYFYSLLSFQCFNPAEPNLYLHLLSNNRIRHPAIVKEKPSRSLLSRSEFTEWLFAVASFFTSCEPSNTLEYSY